MNPPTLPEAFVHACARLAVPMTRWVFVTTVADQISRVFDLDNGGVQTFRCSTSKFGIGQTAGSNCTPVGLHRLAQKIGEGAPVGTVFKGRKPVGRLAPGTLDATAITTRILWLEGLEPGLNCGGDMDTFARYIYIHGTGDETTLGRPASHGCIHLAADDLIPLYDLLPVGTLVWISER